MIRSASRPYRQCRVFGLLNCVSKRQSELSWRRNRRNPLVGLSFCQPNEFLNLVFSFSWDVVSGQDDLDVTPFGVFGDPLAYIVLEVIT